MFDMPVPAQRATVRSYLHLALGIFGSRLAVAVTSWGLFVRLYHRGQEWQLMLGRLR